MTSLGGEIEKTVVSRHRGRDMATPIPHAVQEAAPTDDDGSVP